MQPAGYAAYEEETLRLLRSQTAKTIRPGVLNYDFPGKVLYVESKSPNEELEGFLSPTLNCDQVRWFRSLRKDNFSSGRKNRTSYYN